MDQVHDHVTVNLENSAHIRIYNKYVFAQVQAHIIVQIYMFTHDMHMHICEYCSRETHTELYKWAEWTWVYRAWKRVGDRRALEPDLASGPGCTHPVTGIGPIFLWNWVLCCCLLLNFCIGKPLCIRTVTEVQKDSQKRLCWNGGRESKAEEIEPEKAWTWLWLLLRMPGSYGRKESSGPPYFKHSWLQAEEFVLCLQGMDCIGRCHAKEWSSTDLCFRTSVLDIGQEMWRYP